MPTPSAVDVEITCMIETSGDSTGRVSGFISHPGSAGFMNRLRLGLRGNPGSGPACDAVRTHPTTREVAAWHDWEPRPGPAHRCCGCKAAIEPERDELFATA